MSTYHYQDYSLGDINTGNPTTWIRGARSAISSQVQKDRAFFTSIAYYAEDKKRGGEIELCPLVLDFDMTHPIVDKTDHEVLAQFLLEPLEDLQIVIDFLVSCGVQYEAMRPFFSGGKGFHLHVNTKAQGLSASTRYIQPTLSKAQGIVANIIKEECRVETLDTKIYSGRHLIRYPNSLHQASGLYKTYISAQSISDGVDVRKIMERAKKPVAIPEYKNVVLRSSDWMVTQLEQAIALATTALERQREVPIELTLDVDADPLSDEAPLCVRDVAEYKFTTGMRHKATLFLAGYLHAAGRDHGETLSWLRSWNEAMPDAVTKSSLAARQWNTKTIVNAVYDEGSENIYGFSCRYRHGIKPMPACEAPDCAFIKGGGDARSVVDVPITGIFTADNTDKRIYFNGTTVTLATDPYIVPLKVQFTCGLKDGECDNDNCALLKRDSVEVNTVEDLANVLYMVENPSEKIVAHSARWGKVAAKCQHRRVKVLKYINIDSFTAQSDIKDTTGQLGEVTGLFVGESLRPNINYRFSGKAVPHPRNQRGVLVVDEAYASLNSKDSFQLTENDAKRLFSVFGSKANIPAGLITEWDDLHSQLANHVTHLFNRDMMTKAMMMTYCSALSFEFDGVLLDRGYVEGLIWGDTAQGKTAALRSLQDYIGLGDWVDGKTATRTGLAFHHTQDSTGRWVILWGSFPRNDGGLIVLDEMSGLDESVIPQLTSMRSSGVLQVDGIRRGIARSRVRVIYAGNNRSTKHFADYRYGITGLLGVFGKRKEDIRRLDFVVAASRNDVSVVERDEWKTALRKEPPPPPKFAAGDFSKLVQWAWSRKPGHIHFTAQAISACYTEALLLSDKFDSPIPLTEGMVMPQKLARLAVSVAIQFFSTDATNENVHVRPVHVKLAVHFLNECYNHSALNFADYAQKNRAASGKPTLKYVEEHLDELRRSIESIASSPETSLRDLMLFESRSIHPFTRFELESTIGRGESGVFIRWANRYQILDTLPKQMLQFTPYGSEVFNWIRQHKRWHEFSTQKSFAPKSSDSSLLDL